MIVNPESFKNYTNEIGVRVSIGVTLFSIAMLVIALLGIEFKSDGAEVVTFFALIVELIYGATLCYLCLSKRPKYNHLIPFLFLNWFIGCFSTNILINVFENLPIWVYVVTFLFCISNFFIYSDLKNRFLSPLAYFVNGFSYLLIIYYAIYLIPITPISVFGILALGIGFYGLVPMIVLISHTITLVKILDRRKNRLLFASGIVSVIFGMLLFTVMLRVESKKISANSVTKSFEINDDLPSYITISQNLKPNFLNEIILKKNLIYVGTENLFEFRGFDNFGGKQYNERKIHNPFINIAYLFANDLNLSADDRVNILKSNFDKRLETEEQLWSGYDLFTKNIKEDIKIYTDERIAYTEITMDVACEKKSWGQREAIYSFQLPEGSVATSLSLWVNGVERKGVLTTKDKAEKAYKQIVKVESRDPSLMQWKEGNKVVVRVFPITEDLPRTFKCGFTTPIKVIENKMIYQSLDIKGPNISNAATVSRIQMVGSKNFETSKDFDLKDGFYVNESTGLESWKIIMPLNNLTFSSAFVWKDKVYEVKPIEKQIVAFKSSEIILDLNSSWTIDEIESIVSQKDKRYFVYVNNQKQEINSSNCKEIFTQFKNLQYSLLPLFKLQQESLVITKSGEFSANFEELSNSKYLIKIQKEVKQKRIKVLSISEEMNPFWQTVKEQKYVDYYQTDLKNCLNLISRDQFINYKSYENSVNIESSKTVIRESLGTNTIAKGSNHIYRMYAFGKVLEEQVEIQADSLMQNKYVDLAKDANIVTPISSLVVLETDVDYENNGIEKNVNTLGNASIQNDGAVPEPHEWLMIIAGFGLLFFYYKKSNKRVV